LTSPGATPSLNVPNAWPNSCTTAASSETGKSKLSSTGGRRISPAAGPVGIAPSTSSLATIDGCIEMLMMLGWLFVSVVPPREFLETRIDEPEGDLVARLCCCTYVGGNSAHPASVPPGKLTCGSDRRSQGARDGSPEGDSPPTTAARSPEPVLSPRRQLLVSRLHGVAGIRSFGSRWPGQTHPEAGDSSRSQPENAHSGTPEKVGSPGPGPQAHIILRRSASRCW